MDCVFVLLLYPSVSRGPDAPGGQAEMERSGGPHSDSGSMSPTWDRDRRGLPSAAPGLLGPPGVCTVKENIKK